jgi:hypothetical protein
MNKWLKRTFYALAIAAGGFLACSAVSLALRIWIDQQ